MKKFFNLQRFATTINLTKKADNYENTTSNQIIYALSGNDTVTNYAGKVTISGDAGKDYIVNYDADKVSIGGGEANDQIKTWYSDKVTITGGKGNDSIQLGDYDYIGAGTAKNTVIKYAEGDGNDTVYGFDSNDTLNITSGSYSTSIKGNDFIVTVGTQKIILKNAVGSEFEKVIIKNSKGKLDIYQDWKSKTVTEVDNRANNITLKSAKSGSYITNYGDKVLITGNNGADNIFNFGNYTTISGGKGKDVIYNGGDYVSISGGAGNDEIGSAAIGNYVTVNAGTGNDYISMIDYYDANLGIAHTSYKTVVQYASGDGNDTIRGFNSDDTLHITKGTYSTAVNGTDVIVTVGKSKLTLKDAAGQNLSIKNASGKVTTKFFAAQTSLTSGNDNYTNQIDNNIVYALGGNDYVTNFLASNVTIYGGKGNDTLSDNSLITKNIFMSGDAGNDSLTVFQKENVTLSGGAGNDTLNVKNCSKNVSMIGGNGNDTIEFSNFCSNVVALGGDGKDYINSYGFNYNSTIIGGIGNDTINLNTYGSKNNLIQYASGDGNDTIFGFDANDTLKITSGSYSTTKSGSDFIVTVGKQKITLKDAVNSNYDKINIVNSKNKLATYNNWSKRTGLTGATDFVNTANKVTLSTAVKDGAVHNAGDKVSISGSKGADFLYNDYGCKVTLSGGNGNDIINNNCGNNAKISGGAGNDYISNYGDNYGEYGSYISISGGAGNDTIDCSFSTNNTICGGTGADYISVAGSANTKNIFQYASGDGNDTIYGFREGDTLQITKGTYKTKVSGNDVIVTVGKGSILLQDAKNTPITIVNASGKTSTKTYDLASSYDLIADDNFTTSQLDSILKPSEVGEFNYSSTKQDFLQSILTYSKK